MDIESLRYRTDFFYDRCLHPADHIEAVKMFENK